MNESDKIPCVIEGGYNTSYITSLLSAFFYKENEHLKSILLNQPNNNSGYYLQELIKVNYIEPLRKHYTIKSDALNEIRNYLFINGFLSHENIMNSFKIQSINELYIFLSEYLNSQKMEFDISKIKDGKLIETDNLHKLSMIELKVTNKNTSIRELFVDWITTTLLKEQEEYYCYKLKDVPSYLCFYLKRENQEENTMVDIMNKIKFFKNSDPTQNYIKYKLHSLICFDGKKYYSCMTGYNNKWIMLNENKIPSMQYVSFADDEITEKIKKDVIFAVYTLD
jgi:hypothetical protein